MRYKAFKETLRSVLRSLKAETDKGSAAQDEEGRQRRVGELFKEVHILFSPPALAGLAHSLKPLLPHGWRNEWSQMLAAAERDR